MATKFNKILSGWQPFNVLISFIFASAVHYGYVNGFLQWNRDTCNAVFNKQSTDEGERLGLWKAGLFKPFDAADSQKILDWNKRDIPPVNPVHYQQTLFLQNLELMINVNMLIYVK
jgi:hypothetical protein